MNRSAVTALLAWGALICSPGLALADAAGDCGSGVSAPVEPGASNESEPRRCGDAYGNESPPAPSPMPDVQPSGESALPQPTDSVEPSQEIPEPPPQ